ncbi:unnamed protein product [marine sediment metagenome]|uniref:Uncharacterized protein n=1 Tax=marine sediment metagenome TaxID=412755 RepID=X1UWZ8_9ZZZZ
MKCADVILTLEDLAENPEQDLDINRVHALHFAVAVIRSLPQNLKDCIDAILDLENARLKE